MDSMAEYVKNLGEKALEEEEERYARKQKQRQKEMVRDHLIAQSIFDEVFLQDREPSDNESDEEQAVVVHRDKKK